MLDKVKAVFKENPIRRRVIQAVNLRIDDVEKEFDVEAEKIDATAQKEMRNILEGAEFERSELANRLVREVLEGKAEEAKGASGNNTVA